MLTAQVCNVDTYMQECVLRVCESVWHFNCSPLSCVCSSVLIWLFTVTVNWHVIWSSLCSLLTAIQFWLLSLVMQHAPTVESQNGLTLKEGQARMYTVTLSFEYLYGRHHERCRG